MPHLQSLSVLLVDDNPHMCAITTAVLYSFGIRNVLESHDGAKALALLDQHPVDIAIVDFNMAPMDGVAFTRHVRTSSASPNIYLPIIMMTGHSEKARVFEARDAGVTEFLTKPIMAKTMLDRISAVILKPRLFVQTENYTGPCRRRRDAEGYAGPFRRSGDVARSRA